MMKRTAAWIMTGLLVSGSWIGYTMVKSDATKNDTTKNVEVTPHYGEVQTTDAKNGRIAPIGRIFDNMLGMPRSEEEIRSLDFLTAKEKEALIKAENEAKPHYQRIDELDQKIDQISRKIEDRYQEVLNERQKLMGESDGLWIKILENRSQEEIDRLSNRELIKSSKHLTESEKQQLLKTEDRLDELDQKIDKMYQEIEQATTELNKKRDSYFDKIDQIMKKNQMIWDKIQEHIFMPDLGKDVILY